MIAFQVGEYSEPTVVHVGVIVLFAVAMTYPTSLILILIGIIRRRKYNNGSTEGIFKRANRIARNQIVNSIFCWVLAAAATVFVTLAILSMDAIMWKLGVPVPEWSSDYTVVGIAIGVPAHMFAQGAAYYQAVKETRS